MLDSQIGSDSMSTGDYADILELFNSHSVIDIIKLRTVCMSAYFTQGHNFADLDDIFSIKTIGGIVLSVETMFRTLREQFQITPSTYEDLQRSIVMCVTNNNNNTNMRIVDIDTISFIRDAIGCDFLQALSEVQSDEVFKIDSEREEEEKEEEEKTGPISAELMVKCINIVTEARSQLV